jgi:hypothetical protein
MSTYYYFRKPMTQQELEEVGVEFHTDDLEGQPHTWIVDRDEKGEIKNYLHPSYNYDEKISGFNRYGRNYAQNLEDLLEEGGIDFVSEYELDYPYYEVAEMIGYDMDDEVSEQAIYDWMGENFDVIEYVFQYNKKRYLKVWVQENQKFLKNYLEETE